MYYAWCKMTVTALYDAVVHMHAVDCRVWMIQHSRWICLEDVFVSLFVSTESVAYQQYGFHSGHIYNGLEKVSGVVS